MQLSVTLGGSHPYSLLLTYALLQTVEVTVDRMHELDGLSAAHLKIPPYSACCTDATKLADASKLQSGYFLLFFLVANRVQYVELPRLLLFSCVFRLFATSARNSHFLLFPSSAALGRAGLEAHGRAGLGGAAAQRLR